MSFRPYLGPLRFVAVVAAVSCAPALFAAPKVVLISLDGARPQLIRQYLADGTLSRDQGLGLLHSRGVFAISNVTITPSVTAPGHIAIATGSTAVHNDITANTFHLVASPFNSNVSGFGAPIGGYSLETRPAPSANPTATPIWVTLQNAGKQVVTATWPGGDGVDVTVPGLTPAAVVQPAALRTTSYTVPYGTFGGVGARGFDLPAGSFGAAASELIGQLDAIGVTSFSPIMTTETLEVINCNAFTCSNNSLANPVTTYALRAAAIDTNNDGAVNYDTLVFYNAAVAIPVGPYNLPSTGPAIVRLGGPSGRFFLDGSPNRDGFGFFVSRLAGDLSTVRFARYSLNHIPRNTAVLADVDDINNAIGYWGNQPDFRIPERLSPGFATFPDIELEAVYQDQVITWIDYQTGVGVRALQRNPNADLAMIYVEQPDGSGHQFTLTDPRQATDPTDPNTIGTGQDPAKVSRYADYLRAAYQAADRAVQSIIAEVGINPRTGEPNSNIMVVSDHGMAPFHTAVSINNLLANAGIPATQARAVSTGPAVNIYISLQGREPNGIVAPADYAALQQRIVTALRNALDSNAIYAGTPHGVPLFASVSARPAPVGAGTNRRIGQDSGDVFAILSLGYNFDGTQNPPVFRKGDTAPQAPELPVLSVPNFYGAHGYASDQPLMWATFAAVGPDVGQGILPQVRNIDVAPTILKILRVAPAVTVEGRSINLKASGAGR